jgi:hypothetical protein
MYYFLSKVLINEKEHFFLNGVLYDNDKKKVEEGFDDGKIHENFVPPFLLVLDDSESITKKRVLTDKIYCAANELGSLFLVSPKAQELLSKHAPDDIQMFDIIVKGGNFELADYKIVKVLDKIDCVDLEKSELSYDADYDSIDDADKIVLNEEKIPNNKQIFLLAKRYSAVILIHENLKNAIGKVGLTGFNFYNLDEAYMVIA